MLRLYAHIKVVVAVVVVKLFGFSIITRDPRGATRWKFFLQASRSFLNPPKPPKSRGKPKFRDQHFQIKSETFNDYFHVRVSFDIIFGKSLDISWKLR